MSKERMANFGPCVIPNVGPLDKMSLTREQWRNAWRLIGPTATRNLEKLPLWEVITAAYLEGLHHGSEIVREQQQQSLPPPQLHPRIRDAI